MGIVALLVAATAIAAPRASAYIYVGGPVTSHTPAPSTIERLTLDGSFAERDFITGPRVESADDLHVYGGRLYWVDASAGDCRVRSAARNGSDVQTLVTIKPTRCGSAVSITLAGGYLYWSPSLYRGRSEMAAIGRVSVDPPYNADPLFIRMPDPSVFVDPFSLVNDGEWLYWFDDMTHTVGRARLDGTDVEPAVFQPVPATNGLPALNVGLLGVEHGYLWWQDGLGAGSVGRARPDGSDRDPTFLTGIQMYDGTLTPQQLYYSGSSCGPGCVSINGDVSRIALERNAKPRLLANLGDGVGYSLAVDRARDQYPTVLIRKHRNGTATALVSTRRSGRVSVWGKRIVHESAHRVRAKTARVAIRPRPGARRALRRHGSLHVDVRIVYRGPQGMPQARTRGLTLRLGRR